MLLTTAMCLRAPAEQYIQSLLTAFFIHWTKVHQHPPAAIGTITNTDDDDVPFIALDVLQIFYDQPREHIVVRPVICFFQLLREAGVFRGKGVEGRFDGALLLLAEGHDANAFLYFAAEQFSYQVGNVNSLGRAASFFVHAIRQQMKADASVEKAIRPNRGLRRARQQGSVPFGRWWMVLSGMVRTVLRHKKRDC